MPYIRRIRYADSAFEFDCLKLSLIAAFHAAAAYMLPLI